MDGDLEKNIVIFLEDCRSTNAKLSRLDKPYQYLITSPPDFEEIGVEPSDITTYEHFLRDCFQHVYPSNGYMTILISDRKYKGSIINKHSLVIDVMSRWGWTLVSQKIWVKSFNKNLFRLNYTFILTFNSGIGKKLNPILPDVFHVEHKSVGTYKDNFAKDVVKNFIEAYSNEGDTIYDCFMGSGETALACIDTNRKYIGSEIVPEIWHLCQDRIEGYNPLWTQNNILSGSGKME